MRQIFSLLSLGLLLTTLMACQRSNEPVSGTPQSTSPATTPAAPAVEAPLAQGDLTGGAVIDAAGNSSGALGVYWLTRDAEDPTLVQLEMGRAAQAQGDLYALSVRPYMNASSLVITNTAAGPAGTTDYTFQFTHPFAMPPDLNRPQSATKRVDLFINDVTLVLGISGSDLFFSSLVKTNIAIMPNANGYRMVGPMVNMAGLGVGGGTNVFPYKLLTRANHSAPAGNYDAVGGWLGNEFLAPTGYDVIPQGATATTTMRLRNVVTPPLPVVVIAKYMDPRKGTTSAQKRANRLPDPADPTACRYFMPEGAGDLQDISVEVVGTLKADSSSELATVTATILDWDNNATKASTFPNQSNLNQISEVSRPTQVEVSFPQLRATSPFSGTVGASSGLISEFITVSALVNNVDRTYTVISSTGDLVQGLMRVRDTQDGTVPVPFVLNEALEVQTLPSDFELSTRYQRVEVLVEPPPGPATPNITAVTPLSGQTASTPTFSATNTGDPATSWSWNFGGGATPNTSTAANPTVTLGAVGTYNCSVTATNVAGNSVFPFTLTVTPAPPNLTSVTPLNGGAGSSRTFSATNIGGAATSWSWNFGGGASPNTSTAAGPTVTLGAVGSYSCSVTATNGAGNSTFPFTLTVTSCSPPVISAVNFSATFGLRSSTVTATVTNSPTSWSWNFGGGATPNTSTAVSPSVTLGVPGTYNGTVVATNACGNSNTFPFTLTVTYKTVGMRIRVITSGGTLPTRLQGMPASSWNLTNVNNWIESYVNPLFVGTATRFDTTLTDYATYESPALFNIDTNSEENSLWSLVLGGPSNRINVWVINSQPKDPGLGGVMSDSSCNQNNSGRGCYIIPFNSSFDTIVLPHELGHVFNLPHIRTNTSPLTSANYNLMSYGTLNTSMSSNITREASSNCIVWGGNPMNQFQVVNNWIHQYM
ncbi:MAG: hypothetical protein GEEBNDBF_01965 [bacterium]|nr:hypothetical protein [bacterium]